MYLYIGPMTINYEYEYDVHADEGYRTVACSAISQIKIRIVFLNDIDIYIKLYVNKII